MLEKSELQKPEPAAAVWSFGSPVGICTQKPIQDEVFA